MKKNINANLKSKKRRKTQRNPTNLRPLNHVSAKEYIFCVYNIKYFRMEAYLPAVTFA